MGVPYKRAYALQSYALAYVAPSAPARAVVQAQQLAAVVAAEPAEAVAGVHGEVLSLTSVRNAVLLSGIRSARPNDKPAEVLFCLQPWIVAPSKCRIRRCDCWPS